MSFLLCRFGAILVLYQNYQDRENRYSDGGSQKGGDVVSIYGKTVGPNIGTHQSVTGGSIGPVGLYGAQIDRGTSGSVLSHPGSNIGSVSG